MRVRHRSDAFDFALHCLRRGVATLATAPSVVGDHGEVRGQKLCQLSALTTLSMAVRGVQENNWCFVPNLVSALPRG